LKVLRPATLRVFSLLVVVYSLVGAIVAPNPLTTSANQVQTIPRSIPQTDVNPLGATFFLDREVETWKKEHTLKMARDAGIGWIRQMFPWDSIEPQKGRFWDDYGNSTWDKFDQIVELAQRYNMRIIARLDRPPDWASQNAAIPAGMPVDPVEFGNYVYRVVQRYKGKIQYYQIWNEPNLAAEWGNQPVDPKAYVSLLRIAYQKAKQADPNALILSAPLAQTTETGPLNLNELDYLNGMYAAGAKDYFDILSANAYGFDKPPTDPPSRDTLNFQRVVLLHEIMVQNRDDKKAVWLNEFAWNASPPSFPADKLYWGRVSEEEQAAYTREAIELARTWDWLGVIGIWYFRQVGDILATDRSDYYFRIVDVDFTPRLVYYELQKLAPNYLVAGVGMHEDTHGAVQTGGGWHAVLDPSASGGTILESDQPGDVLTFTFSGTDLTLVHAEGPGLGRASLSVDGSPVRSRPKDKQGQTVLDFYAPSPVAGVHTRVVSGLPSGKHVFQIKTLPAEDQGHPGIGATADAFIVENRGSSFGLFYRRLGLLAVGLLAFGSSFVIWRSR